MSKIERVAVCSRVSTGEQTTANQAAELKAWAERCGHTIVKVYDGHQRHEGSRQAAGLQPAYLKSTVEHEFNMLRGVVLGSAWSLVAASDRGPANHPRNRHRALHPHPIPQHDHPAGRAMFGMLAVFGEFEREMIVARVSGGSRPRAPLGHQSGKAIGRPKGAEFRPQGDPRGLIEGCSGTGSRCARPAPASGRPRQFARNSLKLVRSRPAESITGPLPRQWVVPSRGLGVVNQLTATSAVVRCSRRSADSPGPRACCASAGGLIALLPGSRKHVSSSTAPSRCDCSRY